MRQRYQFVVQNLRQGPDKPLILRLINHGMELGIRYGERIRWNEMVHNSKPMKNTNTGCR